MPFDGAGLGNHEIAFCRLDEQGRAANETEGSDNGIAALSVIVRVVANGRLSLGYLQLLGLPIGVSHEGRPGGSFAVVAVT